MISSVIAKLNTKATPEQTRSEISDHPDLQVGELVDSRMLPVVIETDGRHEMESVTCWLQQRCGVDFIDVVFVHLENEIS